LISFFLIVGLTALAGWSCYRYRHLYITHQLLKADQTRKHQLLYHLPYNWCYWYLGENFVECSPNLCKLLGFEVNTQIYLKDLLKILGDSPFSPFQKALSHLSEFGGEFQLDLSLPERHLVLDIQGRCLNLESFKTDHSPLVFNKKHQLIVLSFSDISERAIEKDYYQTQEKAKAFELEALKTLVNNAPLALWYRDQSSRIRYCNTKYAQTLETSIPRILAENVELIELSQPHSTYELSKEAALADHEKTMTVHKVIDGERRLLKVGEIPIQNLGITVGYALDITLFEVLENELQKNTEAHHEVLHNISVPIAVYGDKTELIFFNQAFLRLFDLEENWLHTKPTYGEVLENLRERRKLPEYSNFLDYKHKNLAYFKNLMQPTYELLHLPEGQILRSVVTPHPLGGLIFLYDDMTDKLSLERGYITLIEVQKETLDHLYEGIVVFGSDNRLKLSNPAMGKIWNLNKDQRRLGSHISEILKSVAPLFIDAQESRIWRREMINQVTGRHPKHGQFRLKGERMIEYSYVPLPDGSNLLTFVDVSDRWRFEESLKDRALTLERRDRLKSDFVSHLSYELKSPLSTINGFIKIMLKQYFGNLNNHQYDYCQNIADASNRLTKLIDNMLELASIEAGKLSLNYQTVEIEHFLKSTTEFVGDQARSQDIRVSVENLLDHPSIEIDNQRLKQALLNLLGNAIKFTPIGGQITLKAAKNLENPNYFKLIIQDTGIGIPVDEQQKILESLDYKTSQSNTGLGLQLAKSLIELHGGHICIESAPRCGTSVVCTLPIKNSCSITDHV
jgi:signal transduction histidine kinase